MARYRVICKEEVSTELFVEAHNKEELSAWILEERESAPDGETAADVVSNLTERQTVQERDFVIDALPWPTNTPPVDFNLTLLPTPKRGDSGCEEEN